MRSAPVGRPFSSNRSGRSLDLGFLILDVLLDDRIVFFLRQLVGLGARVLAGHVVVAGPGAGDELDLQTDGFGHGFSLATDLWRRRLARNLAPGRQMSRNPQF